MCTGFLLSSLLFILLPLSQFIATRPIEEVVVRPVSVTALAAPFTKAAEHPLPAKSASLPAAPKIQVSSHPMTHVSAPPLPQLPPLTPGIGDALEGALDWDTWGVGDTALQPLEVELTTFPLEQLDQAPRRLNNPPVRYPPHLRRSGTTGSVRLLVLLDENGSVEVLEVLSSAHPDFIPPAREAAEQFRYEPPKHQGRVVRTQFILPIHFNLR